MIELPLVFVAGILGTAHCLGMCGPFALAIGAGASGWRGALGRQFAYTAGRVFTYGVLGAIAGYGGARLTQSLPAIVSPTRGRSLGIGGISAKPPVGARGVTGCSPRGAAGSATARRRG